MKRIPIPVLLVLLAAAACFPAKVAPAVGPTPTEFACDEDGEVQTASVDSKTEISIYLPPCYDGNAARPYPAIYLFPGYGGTHHIFFGSLAERVADESIRRGDIPPFLIIAMDDVYPDLDALVVIEKILPFVEEQYRIRQDRRYRAAAGGSFGGAVAYHLAFKRWDLFGSAGVFGNGAAFGEEESIRAWLAAIPEEKKPRVFLNVGESDTYMLERAKALIPLLDEAGISHMEIFTPGKHDGEYWVNNFPTFFRWLAVDWK